MRATTTLILIDPVNQTAHCADCDRQLNGDIFDTNPPTCPHCFATFDWLHITEDVQDSLTIEPED